MNSYEETRNSLFYCRETKGTDLICFKYSSKNRINQMCDDILTMPYNKGDRKLLSPFADFIF